MIFNGTTKTISKQECRYYSYYCTDGYTNTSFNSNKAGSFTVTYNYNGKTAYYNYTVKELVATELTISSTKGTYVVGDNMDSIKVTVKYSNGKTEDVTSKAKVSGFSTNKDNVGNGKVATISYSGLEAKYTYDVKYAATLTKSEEYVGYGFFGPIYNSVYYIEFDIPKNAAVRGMARTDANGNRYTVMPIKYTTTKYYISEADYNEIKKMTGNNPKQTFVVTYSVDGKTFESTYTRVVTK